MHELAIMRRLIDAVTERVRPGRVTGVRLLVGRLSGVIPGALRLCFEVCACGTALEGATLEIDDIPGRGRCRRCGADVPMTSFLDVCGCGSTEVDLVAGDELRVKEVKVQ